MAAGLPPPAAAPARRRAPRAPCPCGPTSTRTRHRAVSGLGAVALGGRSPGARCSTRRLWAAGRVRGGRARGTRVASRRSGARGARATSTRAGSEAITQGAGGRARREGAPRGLRPRTREDETTESAERAVRALLDEVHFVRYAPQLGDYSEKVRDLAARAAETVREVGVSAAALGLGLLSAAALAAPALAARPPRRASRFREANDLVRAGDYPKAIAALPRAGRRRARRAPRSTGTGRRPRPRAGRTGEALWALLRARELDPGDRAVARDDRAAARGAQPRPRRDRARAPGRRRSLRAPVPPRPRGRRSCSRSPCSPTCSRAPAGRAVGPPRCLGVTFGLGLLAAVAPLAGSFARPTAVVVRRGAPLLDAASPTPRPWARCAKARSCPSSRRAATTCASRTRRGPGLGPWRTDVRGSTDLRRAERRRGRAYWTMPVKGCVTSTGAAEAWWWSIFHPRRGAVEDVRGLGHGQVHVVPGLARDVLGTGHEGDVADDVDPRRGGGDAHPGRAGEDLLERTPHRVPAHQDRPARVHAGDAALAGPDRFHRLEVQALEGVVEALVETPDRFPVVRLAMKHEPILSDVPASCARARGQRPRTGVGIRLKSMAAAVVDPVALALETHHSWVGGKEVAGLAGVRPARCPATGEAFAQSTLLSAAQVDGAFAAASPHSRPGAARLSRAGPPPARRCARRSSRTRTSSPR